MDLEAGRSKEKSQGSRRLKSINSSWQLYKAAAEDDGKKINGLAQPSLGRKQDITACYTLSS